VQTVNRGKVDDVVDGFTISERRPFPAVICLRMPLLGFLGVHCVLAVY